MPPLGQPGVSRHRRWLLPAIVLLVGGALAYWGVQREHARMNAIEQQIRKLCRDLADGRDLEGAFTPGNSAVDASVREALARIVDSPDIADGIRVKVSPGDTPIAGPSSQRATHTAILMLDDIELLGMRVTCEDPDKPIIILGIWKPERQRSAP